MEKQKLIMSIGNTIMLTSGTCGKSGGRGSLKGKKNQMMCPSYGNWEQNKLMVLIKCKHVKHAFSKGIATSNNAHDTYCTIVEHDCEQALKACSF
jgi:hypothetical protein